MIIYKVPMLREQAQKYFPYFEIPNDCKYVFVAYELYKNKKRFIKLYLPAIRETV